MKSNAGYTLLQTILALSLGTIVTLGLGAVLVSAQKDHYRKSAQVAIYTVVNNIRFNAASYMAMNKSALENRRSGENPFLAACACGEPRCNKNVTYGLDLYDVAGNKVAGNSVPHYYDHSGESCNPTSPNCIFQATATFQCLGENCGTNLMNESDPVLRISYVLKPVNADRSRAVYGDLLTINSPDIDITANSIRSYAIQNNLCVQVTSQEPIAGSHTGGTTVIFKGSGLAQINSIFIGPSECTLSAQSNAEVSCLTSAGPQGPQTVTLTYGLNEKLEFANAYTYDTSAPQKSCKWRPIASGGTTDLPPCRELNQGEKYPASTSEWECRCE